MEDFSTLDLDHDAESFRLVRMEFECFDMVIERRFDSIANVVIMSKFPFMTQEEKTKHYGVVCVYLDNDLKTSIEINK